MSPDVNISGYATMHVTAGEMRLQFSRGAEVVFQAPSEVLLIASYTTTTTGTLPSSVPAHREQPVASSCSTVCILIETSRGLRLPRLITLSVTPPAHATESNSVIRIATIIFRLCPLLTRSRTLTTVFLSNVISTWLSTSTGLRWPQMRTSIRAPRRCSQRLSISPRSPR